jgi:hypothetical protein
MNESALRTVVASLETLRSSSHWWLNAFTALVVIGVALEVVFVVLEYFRPNWAVLRGRSTGRTERSPRWKILGRRSLYR